MGFSIHQYTATRLRGRPKRGTRKVSGGVPPAPCTLDTRPIVLVLPPDAPGDCGLRGGEYRRRGSGTRGGPGCGRIPTTPRPPAAMPDREPFLRAIFADPDN